MHRLEGYMNESNLHGRNKRTGNIPATLLFPSANVWLVASRAMLAICANIITGAGTTKMNWSNHQSIFPPWSKSCFLVLL